MPHVFAEVKFYSRVEGPDGEYATVEVVGRHLSIVEGDEEVWVSFDEHVVPGKPGRFVHEIRFPEEGGR